jgi:hypothetical protein
MLDDASTAVASVDPLARFGSSAFGPVRLRPISAEGAAGDWVPLGMLVRIPGFNDLRCPRSVTRPCILGGTDLFLAASFAATESFDNPTDVPAQFTGTQFVVPHPTNGVLYLKLRDDPATVQTLTLPVTPISLAASEAPTAKTLAAVPQPAPADAPPAAPPGETSTPAGPQIPAASPPAPGSPAADAQTQPPAPNSN